MKMENTCNLCMYCLADTREAPFKGFYCINEASSMFGEIVSKHGKGGPGCDQYEKTDHNEIKNMSLKEALRIIIFPDDGSYPTYKFNFGKSDDHYIWAARFFKTNKDVLRYRDALERLFDEYIRLSEQDGDFDD